MTVRMYQIWELWAFSLKIQKFFSVTRTFFSHSRSEQFYKQNTILKEPKFFLETFLLFRKCHKVIGLMARKKLQDLLQTTNYGYTKPKSLILWGPNSNTNPNPKSQSHVNSFCRNNGWIMDKGLRPYLIIHPNDIKTISKRIFS